VDGNQSAHCSPACTPQLLRSPYAHTAYADLHIALLMRPFPVKVPRQTQTLHVRQSPIPISEFAIRILGWLGQRLFFFRRFWIQGRLRMPVIDRHRYTVGWKFGYPSQKWPSAPPYSYANGASTGYFNRQLRSRETSTATMPCRNTELPRLQLSAHNHRDPFGRGDPHCEPRYGLTVTRAILS
jgi:hypothetical protein